MSETVNVQEAKTRLSELLKRVEQGEDITIARAGSPVARLVAVEPKKKRELGWLDFELPDSFFDPMTEEELAAWE